MKRFTISALTALSLAAPALALDADHQVEKVDVVFDLQAIESPEAAQFWSDLEGDLETAIIAKVADNIAESGSEIEIDIDEFDMTNTFQSALGLDSSLKAGIQVTNEDDPTRNSFYDLRLTVNESGDFETTEDGVEIVAAERELIYETMVNGFADAVIERLR